MTALDILSAVLAGAALAVKLLLVLWLAGATIAACLVVFVINDIWKTIRIKKERRGQRSQ